MDLEFGFDYSPFLISVDSEFRVEVLGVWFIGVFINVEKILLVYT